MSKKKRANKGSRTKYGYAVAPEFKKHIEETHGKAIDFSDAPDEMRLSDRILRLIDPYMEAMDMIMLVDCATIAWNECLTEDFGIKGPYSLNNVLLNYANHRDLIDMLKFRKRKMFNNNRRHIREVKIYQKGEDMSINVASGFGIRDALGQMLSGLEDESIETFSEADDDALREAVESHEDNNDISQSNPYLKHALLEAVDNQLRENNPPVVRKTFERLQTEGYTAKQAKEKIAAVLVEDIYDVMTTKNPHDEAAYKNRLEELT